MTDIPKHLRLEKARLGVSIAGIVLWVLFVVAAVWLLSTVDISISIVERQP